MNGESDRGPWTIEALRQHFKERLDRRDHDLEHRFDGFPQEYASKSELDLLRSMLDGIRVDHVRRVEFDEVKQTQREASDSVRKRLDEAVGRRSAIATLSGVVAVVIAAMLTVAITRTGPSHADIGAQIQQEAPWITDRPRVESRLAQLEQENERLKLEVAQIRQLDAFFCRTRSKLLPTC